MEVRPKLKLKLPEQLSIVEVKRQTDATIATFKANTCHVRAIKKIKTG